MIEKKQQIFWIKFNPLPLSEAILELPKAIYEHDHVVRWLHFGTKKEKCFVHKSDQVIPDINSYDQPYLLNISDQLIKSLYIPQDFTYQIRITSQRLEIGPTIGLLLGDRNHMYHPDYMKKYSDRLGIYHRFGGIIVAFSLRSIDFKNHHVYGFIYRPEEQKWTYGDTVIPNTIYRRNFHQNQDQLKEIMAKNDGKLFNSIRYDKWELYNILLKNPKFIQYLPKTFLLENYEKMINFLKYNKKIIIKPISLSRGRGIVILELDPKESDRFIFHDYRDKKRPMSYSLSKEKIKEILETEHFFENKHLYQAYIPLAKIEHSPFDIRIVMQKNSDLEWQCSGIECRVAGDREQITNISRGGTAKSLEEAIELLGLSFHYPSIYKNIMELSQEFCYWLDQRGESFAEFGLDVGLDTNGFPWFIEANVFPSFKGFKTLNMNQYLKIRYQPLIYSASSQGFYHKEEG